MKDRNNIFDSGNDDKKSKRDIRKLKNVASDSGYLHDWNEQRSKRRGIVLKRLAVFGIAALLTVSVTAYINMQALRERRLEYDQFLEELTPAPTQVAYKPTPEPVDYSEEFARALQIHEDVVGYLLINDTGIDFPIVQGADNYFFENRNYDRSYSEIAATYMLAECDPQTSRHIVIYGENEPIDDRFSDLNKFLDYDFFYNHEYITLELESGSKTWQVFSVHLGSITFNYKDMDFESNTEYLAYIKMFDTMSRFDRNVELNEKDQVLTLVTDYHDLDLEEGYLMVHARRVTATQ